MKTTLFAPLAIAIASLGFTAAAHAATPEQKAAAKEKWDSLSPAEQAAAKEKAREVGKEKWDSMTPEEKAAARDKAKAKWDSMTPEEQAEAKKRFAEKHPQAAARAAAKKEAAGTK